MTAEPVIGRMPPIVLIGIVAIVTFVSLSIHVVMLQLMGVQYPDVSHIGRLGLLYPLSQSAGLVALTVAALPWLQRFHTAMRGLIVGLLFAAMNGVVRNALMAGLTTTDFGGSVAGFVQQVVFDVLLGTLAVGAVTLIRHTALRIVSAMLIAAFGTFFLNPTLGNLLAPMIAWSAQHTRPEVYVLPYGPNILVPSYLLFSETVIACLVVRYALRLRARKWDQIGLLRYAGIVLLVRGDWVMMFIWGPIIGLASVSQFFFQDLVLVVLLQIAWQRFAAAGKDVGDR